jgi:putative phosphoribosyl transferase
MVFRNRREAGRYLASKLQAYRGEDGAIVLGLPRGGIPVAYEVADALMAALDVFVVRKLGLPGREELAMGAVASGDIQVLNEDVVDQLHIPLELIEQVASRERRELHRQEALYRRGRRPLALRDQAVILVDDGLATGSTMRAAIEALRRHEPRRVVAAVPVGAPDTCSELAELADEVVCAAEPEDFMAVGAWYADFSPTTDEEVEALLWESERRRHLPIEAR